MLRNVGVNRHHENPTVLVDTNSLRARDRKSTRLNSSHDQISYAVFCLKKKKKTPLTKAELTLSLSLSSGSHLPTDAFWLVTEKSELGDTSSLYLISKLMCSEYES